MKLFTEYWGPSSSDAETFSRWEAREDDFGHESIYNERINQRINVMRSVRANTFHRVGDHYTYQLADHAKIINSYSNMNLSLASLTNNDSEEEHAGEHLLYFVYDSSMYRLLEYEMFNQDLKDPCVSIIHTFRKKDDYCGCAILFNVEKAKKQNHIRDDETYLTFPIISVSMEKTQEILNSETGELEEHVGVIRTTIAYCNEKETNDEYIGLYPSENLDEMNIIHASNIIDNPPNRKFMLSSVYGRGVTLAYLINKADYEEVKDRFSGINNVIIIGVDPAALKAPSGEVDEEGNPLIVSPELHKIMRKNIVEGKVHAVSIVNLHVPKDFCRNYKIWFLFNYNPSTEISTPIVCR